MPFFLPIVFRLSQLTATTGGEFKSINSSGIVYSYDKTPIGKPFLVSIYLFCSLPISASVIIFQVILTDHHNGVEACLMCSYDHVTSFDYDGKNARDVGLTC